MGNKVKNIGERDEPSVYLTKEPGLRLYCANPKTVNTRIISGMLLCFEEKANQMQDEKTSFQISLAVFYLLSDWSSHN